MVGDLVASGLCAFGLLAIVGATWGWWGVAGLFGVLVVGVLVAARVARWRA